MTRERLSDAKRQMLRAEPKGRRIATSGTHANPYEALGLRGRQARGLISGFLPDPGGAAPHSSTPSHFGEPAGRSWRTYRADRVGVVIPFRYSPHVSSKTASAAPDVRNRDISTTGLAVKLWMLGAFAATPAVALGVQQVQHDAITFTLPVVAGIVACVGGFLLVVFRLYRELERKAYEAARTADEALRRLEKLEGKK